MQTSRFLALVAGAVLVTSAGAQPTLASDADLARGRPACEAAIRDRLKDPESARFTPPDMGLLKDGQLFMTIKVNAKNSYGGYVGAKTWACWLNARTFKVDELHQSGA